TSGASRPNTSISISKRLVATNLPMAHNCLRASVCACAPAAGVVPDCGVRAGVAPTCGVPSGATAGCEAPSVVAPRCGTAPDSVAATGCVATSTFAFVSVVVRLASDTYETLPVSSTALAADSSAGGNGLG